MRARGRQRPGDQRADRPLLGQRLAEVFQQAGRTDRRAQADVRVQLGGGHADPRGGRGQPAFGLAHVRAALQQRAAIAHRQRLGQGRGLAAVAHAVGQLPRGAAEQGRQLVFGGLALRVQRRQRRFQHRDLGVGAGQLRRGAAAGVDQPLGDLAAALLQLQRVLGHVQLMVGVADLHVAAGHLRPPATRGPGRARRPRSARRRARPRRRA